MKIWSREKGLLNKHKFKKQEKKEGTMTKRSLVPMIFGRGFEPFKEISRDLERLEGSFNDLWRGASLLPWVKEQAMIPNIDVIENDREIQVVADLPGLDEKDIHIDVENGIFS